MRNLLSGVPDLLFPLEAETKDSTLPTKLATHGVLGIAYYASIYSYEAF